MLLALPLLWLLLRRILLELLTRRHVLLRPHLRLLSILTVCVVGIERVLTTLPWLRRRRSQRSLLTCTRPPLTLMRGLWAVLGRRWRRLLARFRNALESTKKLISSGRLVSFLGLVLLILAALRTDCSEAGDSRPPTALLWLSWRRLRCLGLRCLGGLSPLRSQTALTELSLRQRSSLRLPSLGVLV